MSLLVIAILFLVIALLYASVGFGGGSSYIAVLLLFGFAVDDVRLIAIVCNIVVVAGGVINYRKAKLMVWREVLPIVILSIPLAYLGGGMQLSGDLFKIVAAVALLIAAGLMLLDMKEGEKQRDLKKGSLGLLGGGIGFLSGLIGIGGGIFLAPVLHVIKWRPSKQIAATASAFILVNSLSGLAGQLTTGVDTHLQSLLVLALSVLVGGQVGSRLSIKLLSAQAIKYLTIVLITFVGLRIILLALIR